MKTRRLILAAALGVALFGAACQPAPFTGGRGPGFQVDCDSPEVRDFNRGNDRYWWC